jgi:excisionase family DNA binding protein
VNIGKIDPEQLLTSSEVGALLQVNSSSVKNWVDEGRLLAFRTPGGHRRIRAADLVAFLDTYKIPVPSPLAGASTRRLLLVDDDEAQLRALARALKRHADRVTVQTAANGIDALVLVGAFKPHHMLLDVYMPGLDGLEVCRRLKANPETSRIEVLMTTGHLTPSLERQALEAGASRCLAKPINVPGLLSHVGVSPRQL